MRIDATKIAPTQGDAVAVEELQDLDGDLSPVVNAIPELRRRELSVRSMKSEILDDPDHLGHRAALEEMVMGDLVDVSEAAQKLAEAADHVFRLVQHAGNVPHPGRTEALLAREKRLNRQPCALLPVIEAHLVTRQTHP